MQPALAECLSALIMDTISDKHFSKPCNEQYKPH